MTRNFSFAMHYRYNVFIITLIIMLFNLLSCKTESDPEPSSVKRIPSATAETAIWLDCNTDSEGGLHLVWRSEYSPLFYQASDDCGSSWSLPAEVFDNSVNLPKYSKPFIYSTSDSVIVLLASHNLIRATRELNDDASNWSTQISKISPLMSEHDLCRSGDTVWLGFSCKQGVYVTRSLNNGSSWERPVEIARHEAEAVSVSGPTLTVESGICFLIWSEYKKSHLESDARKQTTLHLAIADSPNSLSQAQNQHIVTRTDNVKFQSSLIQVPQIIVDDSSMQIFYERSGLHHIVSHDGGLSWKAVAGSPGPYSKAFKIAHVGDNSGGLLWVDKRHRRIEWWGKIPGHVILTWDNDPSWINNDIYFSTITGSGTTGEQRLSAPLSFTTPDRRAMSASVCDSAITVVWSGRKKVGRTLSETSSPVEIFYETITINAGKE